MRLKTVRAPSICRSSVSSLLGCRIHPAYIKCKRKNTSSRHRLWKVEKLANAPLKPKGGLNGHPAGIDVVRKFRTGAAFVESHSSQRAR